MTNRERPEHLGPMARSLVETFAGLTVSQQRRVFALMRDVLETNEQMALSESAAMASEARPDGDSERS